MPIVNWAPRVALGLLLGLVALTLLWACPHRSVGVAPAPPEVAPTRSTVTPPLETRGNGGVERALVQVKGLRFVDVSGAPVPRVTVLGVRQGLRAIAPADILERAAADSGGFLEHAQIAKVRAALPDNGRLVAMAAGFVSQDVSVIAEASRVRNEDAVLTMDAGRPLSLRFKDLSGAYVPELEVLITQSELSRELSIGPDDPPAPGAAGIRLAVTDALGRINLACVPVGKFFLAMPDTDWQVMAPDDETVTVTADSADEHEVTVARVLMGQFRYEGQVPKQRIQLPVGVVLPRMQSLAWSQAVQRRWPGAHSVVVIGQHWDDSGHPLSVGVSWPDVGTKFDLPVRRMSRLSEDDIVMVPRGDLDRCGRVMIRLWDADGKELREVPVMLEPMRGTGDVRLTTFVEHHVWAGTYRALAYVQFQPKPTDRFEVKRGEALIVDYRLPRRVVTLNVTVRLEDGSVPRTCIVRVKGESFGRTSPSYRPENVRLWVPREPVTISVDVFGFSVEDQTIDIGDQTADGPIEVSFVARAAPR